MFTRRLVVGLISMSVLLGTGCSSNKSSGTPAKTSSPPSPTSPAPSTAGPASAAERDVLVAYRGMWSAFVEAGKTSDPDAPDLRKYASDDALTLIVGALYTNREQKEVILGEVVLDPRVTEVRPPDAPTEAAILDCVNDEKWLEYKLSGGLVDDIPGGRHRTTATVKRVNGEWKVSAFTLERSGTC